MWDVSTVKVSVRLSSHFAHDARSQEPKGLGKVSLRGFRCSLSVSFHQSNINIFMLTLLLSGQTGEAREPSNKEMLSRISRRTGKKISQVLCWMYAINICRPNLRLNVFFLIFSVDKKNQLDVTFCILYFSSNSCSTCFGQPCAHHQKLTTA